MFHDVISGRPEEGGWLRVSIVDEPRCVVAVPHGGGFIPKAAMDVLDVKNPCLVDDVDHHALEIYDVRESADMVTTRIHRHVVDCNRDRGEAAFRNNSFSGESLHVTPPSAQLEEVMLSSYYDPFVNAVETALKEIRDETGAAFLLNAHTMGMTPPAALDEKCERPAFCIGTNGCTSADPGFIWRFHDSLHEHAYDFRRVFENFIRLDDPYRGRGLTRMFSQKGYNSLLLEVNEGLYIDPDSSAQEEKIALIRDAIGNVIEDLF